MQYVSDEINEISEIKDGVSQLVASVARLRSPTRGCMWFRRQTFQTLRRYLLEEVYEVQEALNSETPEQLQEELGDLLFQIIVLGQLATEQGWFSLKDVLYRINEKVIHRNPHVFGEQRADTVEEAQRIWLERKSLEKTPPGNTPASPLDGLSMNMPALALAQTYLGRCSFSNTGWTFPYPSLVFDFETRLVSHPDGMETGLGRMLFMLADLACRHQLDAEAALQKINVEFRRQSEAVVRKKIGEYAEMKQMTSHAQSGARFDIQDQQVVILFPNHPAVNFSLNIPDIRCAGYSPTYTYKAWLWCAYINALHAAKIKLGYERNQKLFRRIWRGVKKSRKV